MPGHGLVIAEHSVREPRYPLEHGMYLGNDVNAIDNKFFARPRTQRDMQHRTLLGGIDQVAAEHDLDATGHAAFGGKGGEKLQCPVVDAVLGVIQV